VKDFVLNPVLIFSGVYCQQLCCCVFVFLYEGVKPSAMSAYLEITDIVNRHLRYVPVPAYVFHSVILIVVCSLILISFN